MAEGYAHSEWRQPGNDPFIKFSKSQVPGASLIFRIQGFHR